MLALDNAPEDLPKRPESLVNMNSRQWIITKRGGRNEGIAKKKKYYSILV